MRKLVCEMAVLFALVGCATGPRFEDYVGLDASCVDGDVANFFKQLSEEEANVNISKIDRLPVHAGKALTFGPHCLNPGTHIVDVIVANTTKQVEASFSFSFEPGKKYKLKANEKNLFTFELRRLDVTAGQEAQVGESLFIVTNDVKPLPIFMPPPVKR